MNDGGRLGDRCAAIHGDAIRKTAYANEIGVATLLEVTRVGATYGGGMSADCERNGGIPMEPGRFLGRTYV